MTDEEKVLATLDGNEGSLLIYQIAEQSGLDRRQVTNALRKLTRDNKIIRVDMGEYQRKVETS